MRLAASAATCSNGTNGLHRTTAWPSSSIPRRPARPVSWVYSPAVSGLVAVAGELGQLLDHHGPRRHVDADGQGLGGEHDLDQPLDEARLHRFLERRDHPGVVGGDPGLELGEELAVAENGEIVVGQPLQPGVDDLPDAVALGAGGEPHPGGQARAGGFVALVAAEDEHDRRQQLALLEQVDGLDPTGGVEHAASAAPRWSLVAGQAPVAHRRGVEAGGLGVGPPSVERLEEVQPVVGAVADEIAVVEAHRAAQLDDRGGRPADGLDPGGQLARVAHRRREAHEADVGGQVDDHLLPHRAAIGVLQVVDLVEHDQPEAVERRRAGVDHVAQHLGGHHHHGGVAVDRVVTGEQPDLSRPVAFAEVAELLVRQRLERRGVERSTALPPGGLDAVLGDDGLAAPGRRGHDDVVAGVERVEAPRAGSGRARTGTRRRSRPGRRPPDQSLRPRPLRASPGDVGRTSRSRSRRSTGRASGRRGRATRSDRRTA